MSFEKFLISVGVKKPKCIYCEQSACNDDPYYYFCSLECLEKYAKPGSYLDRDVHNRDRRNI